MRTGIYVFETCSVKIRPTDPRDARACIYRYSQQAKQLAASVRSLEPGVYMVVSSAPIQVDGANLQIQTQDSEKDPWPDPGVQVAALVPGATTGDIREFFRIAFDVSVDDPGDGPAESAGDAGDIKVDG
jgi:hypothetical protein